MKFGLINSQNMLISISETEFNCISADDTVVELTDEQAEQFNSATDLLFLIDGNLVSYAAKRWSENPEAVKENLRKKRNRLLDASDWTQLKDNNLSEEESDAWLSYRQELRDLTDNIDANGEAIFPTNP